MILADGKVTDEERNLFIAMCDKQGLTPRQTNAIIGAVRAGGGQAAHGPANLTKARLWLEQLASVIADRGRIPAEDQQILSMAAAKLGLSDWDASAIAKQVKARALHDARKLLATRKAAKEQAVSMS